ncbi:plasmid maintenance protein [Borreliella valaisiana]|uniref:plasmid maintenance protein n=1 Tax=Borreliella valaisiana TaxID=62088 RepID=UPI001AEFE8F0|nr:plasmid maintenance protein [Borreliella valaisiana]
MSNLSNITKSTSCHNKLQHKLIVLISAIQYVNSKYQKYTQKTIFYYFNENLKRNGQATTTLRTMQKYLYKLEKKIKITTNYYKHLGVSFGTEIYYHLNYSKKECYQKINKYFEEKKLSRFQNRVKKHLKEKFTKKGNVNLEKCFNNKNNNIKEEERNKKIEKFQVINYSNKCNFYCKKFLPIVLNLDISKNEKIKILKTVKRIEIKLIKGKNINLNKSCFKEKQNKLKEILENTKKQLEKKGYNAKQLKINFQKTYENYKNKPHFIIEYHKYNDLSTIKRKLEKSIELKKENPQKDYENIKTNIYNILIEQLKEKANIEFLKPIVKTYLNNKNKIEYKKVFGTYYYELLELIKDQKSLFNLKELDRKAI